MKCLFVLLAIVINDAWCLLPGEDNFVKSSVTPLSLKSKDEEKASKSAEGTAEGKDGRREKKGRTFLGPLSLDFGDKFSIESSSCCGSKYGSHGNEYYPSRYGSRPGNRYDWQSSSYPLGLTGSSESFGRPGGNTYNDDRYGSRPGYGASGRPGRPERPSFSIGGSGGFGGGSHGGDGSEFGGGFQGGRPGSFSGGSGSFGEGSGGYGNGGYGGGYEGGGHAGRPSYGGRPGLGGGGPGYGGGGPGYGGAGPGLGGGGPGYGGGGPGLGGGGPGYGGAGPGLGGGGPGYGISGTFGDHTTFGGHGDVGGYPDDTSSRNIQTQKALALKALAGVALIGAAAALASNPVLLPLGAVSGRRKRSNSYYDRDQSYGTGNHDEITQDHIILKNLLTSPKCIARLACEVQHDYVTDIKKYKDTTKKHGSVYYNLENRFSDLIRTNILDSKYVRKHLKDEITRAVAVGASEGSCKVFPCDLTA